MALRSAAFVGLGRMGAPMASHLSAWLSGHDGALTVLDADAALTQAWASEHGDVAASSVAQAVAGAELVVSSLPADAAVLAVAELLVPAAPSGLIWVDHSTTSAGAAKTVASMLADAGGHFIDAPVSGGVEGARNGSLTVMAGGDAAALERVRVVIGSYAARVTRLGESGAGQVAKMTNQICVLGLCQALAEGLDFATRAGLEAEQLVDVMLHGSSASWQMRNRAMAMLGDDFEFGFSTALMRKDVGLVLEQARAMGVSLPVTETVAGYLDEVDAMGGADWDWCSLAKRQRQTR